VALRHRLIKFTGVAGRRASAPLALALARLWSRRGQAALAALGAAAGAALLATVLAAGHAVEDRSLQRGVASLPAGERAVRAAWGGIPTDAQDRFAPLDQLARRTLGPITGQAPSTFMLYREWRIGGALVDLGAADQLERWVQLRTGRFPRACTRARCEVVRLTGSGRLPQAPGLHLVRVGTGSMVSKAPFGELVSSETSTSILSYSQKYHRPAQPPFVLAEGVGTLSSVPYLADDYRSYAWLVPLAAGSVHPWNLDRFTSEVTSARSTLAAHTPLFSLTSPDDQLAAAEQTGRAGERRLLLLGGEAAALLLAFSILTASGLRRDAEVGRRRLTWLGARRWQLALESTAEAAVIAAAGTALGWFVGAGPAALVARHLGSEPGPILSHSVLSPLGLAVVLGLAAAAAFVLLASLWIPPLRVGGISLSLLDVAALGAIVAIVLAFTRGSTHAATLAETNGTSATLLLLPGLLAFVAAVLAARLVALLPRLLERLGRRGPIESRLALLSLARSPGRAAAAVAFLVVSLGLALFAAVYRSTLVQGQRDQAAFAFPRRVVVGENFLNLVPVLGAAPLASYERLGNAAPVIRLSGNVSGLSAGAFTLLGVPAHAVPTLAGWRKSFSGDSLSMLATRLALRGPVALRGAPLPPDAKDLEVPAEVRANVNLRAQIETTGGDFVSVPLTQAGRGLFTAKLPATARGGRLEAFSFEARNNRLSLSANSVRGAAPTGTGTIVLGRPRAATPRGTRTLALDYAAWAGTGGLRVRAAAGRATLRFLVTPELETRFRVRQPLDGRAVPVVVSERLAAAAGSNRLLPIDIEGRRVLARVVGSASRFPSTTGDFVLADRATLHSAMNGAYPGSATTNEIWIDPPPGQSSSAIVQALSQPPFDVLQVRSRSELEQRLSGDPLARGSLLALAAAAAVALALALAGLLFEIVADLRDERGELFDLEAQGATPTLLRRRLRLRSAFVVLAGLAGGLATGAALSALVIDLVKVTANATEPEPPLQASPGWALLALALTAYLAVTLVVVAWATRRAFRAPSAGRLVEAG
jgi:FtsX-like permease family protein